MIVSIKGKEQKRLFDGPVIYLHKTLCPTYSCTIPKSLKGMNLKLEKREDSKIKK